MGHRYGRLAVISEGTPKVHPSGNVSIHWVCQCDCGVVKEISGKALASGIQISCGCANAERVKQPRTHGLSRTPEHKAWCGMIGRCHNPRNKVYQNYGGRGIYVCDLWRNSFEAFYAHIGLKPSPKHSVDRIDNNSGYRPGNVRWATAIEQRHNQRPHQIKLVVRCIHGHVYTDENTYTQPGTRNRQCKVCRDIREARRPSRIKKRRAA